MSFRFAFIGFRHAHILDLYRRVVADAELTVVAACEADPAAAAAMRAAGIHITHTDADSFWDDLAAGRVPCDVVAVGDTFDRRGGHIIRALTLGKHVISDKPVCTRLDELARIADLVAARGLALGCMLDLRDSAAYIGLHDLVQSGALGPIQAIGFGGQHPLLLGQRPDWYFEPGRQGGTINDIAVHACDAIPWITAVEVATVNAARTWQGFYHATPEFHDAGQVMLTLADGCGVLGDVSYFAPDSFGYALPYYWRMTLWGRDGVAETALNATSITVHRRGASTVENLPLPAARPGGYLAAFLRELAGQSAANDLTTAQVLRASRVALIAQDAADRSLCHVPVGPRMEGG